MTTIFTHPAPAVVLAAGLGSRVISLRLAMTAVACTLLPDADVVGFKLGIKYTNILGHRGFSHSLVLAFAVGCLGFICAPWLRAKRWLAFVVCSGALASHILLDALTDGGLGVAAFWPFSDTRYFLPWRPIAVSPISPRAFFTQRGLDVLYSEFIWVWLPCLFIIVLLWWIRKTWGIAGANARR